MIIKTLVPKYHNDNVENYINKPIFDKISDVSIGELKDNRQPSGIIKNAKFVGDNVELEVEIFDKQLDNKIAASTQVSFSMKQQKK